MLSVPQPMLQYWETQPDEPATPDAVAALETAVGRPLPEDYKAFLTRYGYKKFQGRGLSRLSARYDMNLEMVEKPVRLMSLMPIASVEDRLKVFGQPMELDESIGRRIPPDMLPIGEAAADTSGLLLMQLGEQNYGSVWYWERVDETWGTGENTLLGAVGRDLNDMLAKVRTAAG